MKNLLLALLLSIAPFSAYSDPAQATTQNIQNILSSNTCIVLDIYADWCPPCKQLAPVFQAVHQEFGGKYTFAKINGPQEPGLASDFNVKGYPTLIFIKNGQEVGRQTGYVSRDLLVNMLTRYFQ